MNEALITRLFKSIEGEENTPLMKVAYSIIEDEKRKGHSKLATKLNAILESNIDKYKEFKPTLKVVKEGNYKMPVDRR